MNEVFQANDTKLPQVLLNYCVVCQRDDFILDLGLSTFQDEFPDRLQIWKSLGHIRFHYAQRFYGSGGHFDKDTAENLLQAKPCNGPLHS